MKPSYKTTSWDSLKTHSFNPSATTCHLPYGCATPRNATGHGKGRSLKVNCPKKLDKLHLTESVSSYS